MRDLINGRPRHVRIDEAQKGAAIAGLLLAAILVLFVLAVLGVVAIEPWCSR